MKNLNNYIKEEYEKRMYDLLCEEYILNEHIFNGKTNGRTWWGDIKAGLAFLGVTLGAGIVKFWNWLFKDSENKKEENGGKWPDFDKEIEKSFSENKIDWKRLHVVELNPSKFENLLLIVDTDKAKNKGFWQAEEYYNKKLKKSGNNEHVLRIFAVEYLKDYLAIIGVTNKSQFEKLPDFCIFDFNSQLNKYKDIKGKLGKYAINEIIEKSLKGNHIDCRNGFTINLMGEKWESLISLMKLKKQKVESGENRYIYTKTEEDDQQTNESLDEDNIMWKIEKWFDGHDEQYQTFIELISKYGRTVNVKELEKDIENSDFRKELKPFINFLWNDFDFDTDKDYLYRLKMIIEFFKHKKLAEN